MTMTMTVTQLNATTDPDRAVCIAARNDYMTDAVGAMDFEAIMAPVDGDDLSDKQETLIGHLLDHLHFGPFEHPQATFGVEGISRVCMAQLTRHRLASFDVQSFRYTQPDRDDLLEIHTNWADRWPDMREYVVVPRVFREYGPDDGSEGVVYEQVYLQQQLDAFVDYLDAVEWATEHGAPEKRAKEDARYLLPQGAKVNLVVSMNLRQWLHIADMRAAGDAHWEIRELTAAILDHLHEWAPITMGYYEENLRNRKNRLAP